MIPESRETERGQRAGTVSTCPENRGPPQQRCPAKGFPSPTKLPRKPLLQIGSGKRNSNRSAERDLSPKCKRSAVQRRATQTRARGERERDRNKELGREQELGCCLYDGNGKKNHIPNPNQFIHPCSECSHRLSHFTYLPKSFHQHPIF